MIGLKNLQKVPPKKIMLIVFETGGCSKFSSSTLSIPTLNTFDAT